MHVYLDLIADGCIGVRRSFAERSRLRGCSAGVPTGGKAPTTVGTRSLQSAGTYETQPNEPKLFPRADHFFFVGSFLRLVLARSRSCFSDIDSAIFLEGPFKLDFFCSPRLAASAAPAAFCCFFERAGILLYRFAPKGWLHMLAKGAERK